MEDYSDYRETPRTGRTPGYSAHELEPREVDPSVLTDDRENPDLFTFEKTWGHRMLAGLGVAMLVIALVLAVYSVVQLVRVADIASILPEPGMFGMIFWGIVLACAIALIPPAGVAIYVAKNPRNVAVAIILAIVALVLVVVFFAFAVASAPHYFMPALLYALLFALFPVLYLIAALKIKSSNQ